MQARVVVTLLLGLLSTGGARAEPRELLLMDGTVVGAIFVDPPPEWTPVVGSDAFNAYLEDNGLLERISLGSERRQPLQPSGPSTLLRLGRSVGVVPQPPRQAFRSGRGVLKTASGTPIVDLACATTEVLGPAVNGRFPVRVYRSGPAGERYVLQGFTDTAPTHDLGCLARTSAFDVGTLPDYWQRVPTPAPRMPTSTGGVRTAASRGVSWAASW